MNKIDFLLGGDMGEWALDHVPFASVAHVVTFDERLAERARSLGFRSIVGNANTVAYTPSEIGFSVHYPAILKPVLMSKCQKVYNLHPGYLPWGRGYYPIFWALWEQTPAGATLHEISAGVDEGPIVAQTRVQYNDSDTGGSLFSRIRRAEQDLFLEYLPKILNGNHLVTYPQPAGGSAHRKREFEELKQKAEWEKMCVKDLMRLVRALTFPGHSGLEVTLGSERFELCLSALIKG